MKKGPVNITEPFLINGGADQDRTDDLLNAIELTITQGFGII